MADPRAFLSFRLRPQRDREDSLRRSGGKGFPDSLHRAELVIQGGVGSGQMGGAPQSEDQQLPLAHRPGRELHGHRGGRGQGDQDGAVSERAVLRCLCGWCG